jgi:protein-S-isoprenylcysteine O-methyltransferase Ste14
MSFASQVVRRFRGTSFRTFILYPLVTVAWELLLNGGGLRLEPVFSPLMVWGYLQYRLVGQYRIKRGGGGPGLDTPPERLVTTGPFACTRNPMYLGHIIFLAGLALTLTSLFAALLTIVTTIWFHFRVLGDESKLRQRFGQPYLTYLAGVKRWVPGLF